MKRILVPTDFSIYAEEALKAAAKIARKNNSEIFLLHMLELPNQMSDAVTGGNSIPEVMLFMKKAHEMFEKIKERIDKNKSQVESLIKIQKKKDVLLKKQKEKLKIKREADSVKKVKNELRKTKEADSIKKIKERNLSL